MNLRVTSTGAGLVGLAGAFFLGMMSLAPRSHDPVAMMRAVGQAAGGAGGIGLAMIVFGLLRKTPQAKYTAEAVPAAAPAARHSLAVYTPLVIAVAEVLWLLVLVLGLLFAVGDTPYVNTPENEHFFQLAAALPVAAGMIWGVICGLLHWPRGVVQWVALIVGIVACAAWCEAFALGYVR